MPSIAEIMGIYMAQDIFTLVCYMLCGTLRQVVDAVEVPILAWHKILTLSPDFTRFFTDFVSICQVYDA